MRKEKKEKRKGERGEGGGDGSGKVLCFMPLSLEYTLQPEQPMGYSIVSLYLVLLLVCGIQCYISIYGLVMGTVNMVSATVQGKLR